MTRKKKIGKVDLSFTIKQEDLEYNKMTAEELQKYLIERNRGCGRHKSTKDYTRKSKYKRSDY